MPPITDRGLQVPFKERGVREGESPRFTVEPGFQSASRVLAVAWSDAVTAWQQLVGYSYLDTEVSPRRIRRWLPAQCPMMPQAVCRKVAARGYGALVGQNNYQDFPDYGRIATYPEAILEVDYTSVNFGLMTDDQAETAWPTGEHIGEYTELGRYVEYSERQSSKYLSFPVGSFAWSEGPNAGSKFPGNPGKIECQREQHLKLLEWPLGAWPKTAIDNCLGRVNKFQVGDARPRTLLMLSADRKQEMNPRGDITLQLEYCFADFKPGHVDLFDFRPNSRAYYQVSADGVFYEAGTTPDGKLIFDEADFYDLFVPESA